MGLSKIPGNPGTTFMPCSRLPSKTPGSSSTDLGCRFQCHRLLPYFIINSARLSLPWEGGGCQGTPFKTNPHDELQHPQLNQHTLCSSTLMMTSADSRCISMHSISGASAKRGNSGQVQTNILYIIVILPLFYLSLFLIIYNLELTLAEVSSYSFRTSC